MKRRGVLAGLAVLVSAPFAGPVLAETVRPRRRPDPARALDDMIAEANLGAAEVAFAVGRASGGLLQARAGEASMPPASCLKALTALFALERLGPDFRFQTRVMALGEVRDGRLDGDLLLVGGGDPVLDTDRMGDLVKALAETGLRAVTGRFLAVTGALPGMERLVDDQPDHVGYNPALGGLNLNFNRIYFEWRRAGAGWTTWTGAFGERFRTEVATARVDVVDRDLPIFTYARGDGQDRWTVAATALNDEGSRWLPVRDPGAYAAEAFRQMARAEGIALPEAEVVGILPEGAVPVVTQEGEPLAKVLKDMLRFSTNLTAEVVGLTATGAGSLGGSARVVQDWLKRRFGVEVRLRDHSGLNGESRVTAAAMVAVLQGAKGLPEGGALGTLLREMGLPDAEGKERKDHPVRVRAKSGTMNFVSGLVGYLGEGEGQLAFALLSADVPRREAVTVAEREEPEGAAGWTKRARRLQARLLGAFAERWL